MSEIIDLIDELEERSGTLIDLADGPVNQGFPARAKLHDAAETMQYAASLLRRFTAYKTMRPNGSLTSEPAISAEGVDTREKLDSGTRYHIVRDNAYRMVVKGSELKNTDIVENVDEPDSREKLEADVREYLTHGGKVAGNQAMLAATIVWLDRQAAITEREVEHDLMKAGHIAVEVERSRIADLQARVEKLTAERDRLSNQLALWENLTAGIKLPRVPFCEFQPKDKDRQIAELTAERDRLQRVVKKQAESFGKLEAENAELRDVLFRVRDALGDD